MKIYLVWLTVIGGDASDVLQEIYITRELAQKRIDMYSDNIRYRLRIEEESIRDELPEYL